MLDAVRIVAPHLPELHLWLCYAAAPLLDAVTSRIQNDATLRDRVHLLGRLSHATIETMMQAADLFVLGSHREGSGYALIEALACGLAPIVTDIPSFSALTAGGQVGRLWRCGDAQDLADALVTLARDPQSRSEVRAHFDAEISFAALGRKLIAAYEDVRTHHATRLNAPARSTSSAHG